LGCHGGFSLDENLRRSWYNPEAVLKEAGLQEGMTFVDVGCGDGFFSLLAAKVVDETGTVYAVDTDAQAIQKLQNKATEQGIRNIHATTAPAEEILFCNGCADIVFYSMVLHDFNDPAKVLSNAKQMLKPGGTLADLDWKKKQMDFGPPFEIRFSERKAAELIKQAGMNLQTIREAGQHHYLITARP
jgi:ubiquinone/menaquinone biosynthesis C-methylase UbiE